MKTREMARVALIGFSAVGFSAVMGATNSLAKGVEDMKPGAVETAPAPAEAPKADAPKAEDTVKVDEPKAAEPAKEQPAEKPKDKPKAKDKPKEEPKPERSEASKSLDGKLYVGTSLGVTTITGAKGEWSGGGTSDIMAGYKLPITVMDKLGVWGTFRYQPISATLLADHQSYRVVVHSYGFGGQAKFAVMPLLTATANAELAYCAMNLHSVDGFNPDSSLSKGGVRMVVGGGAEWTFLEKVLVGGRVNVGSGSYTTMEMAATVAMMF